VPGGVVAAGGLVEPDGVLGEAFVVWVRLSEVFQERQNRVAVARWCVRGFGCACQTDGGVGGLYRQVFPDRVDPYVVAAVGERAAVVAQ
jgi:hypothetical protein